MGGVHLNARGGLVDQVVGVVDDGARLCRDHDDVDEGRGARREGTKVALDAARAVGLARDEVALPLARGCRDELDAGRQEVLDLRAYGEGLVVGLAEDESY